MFLAVWIIDNQFKKKGGYDMFKHFLLILVLILMYAAPASADNPMSVIQEGVEEIIELLNDPEYEAPEKKEEQREKIWEVVNQAFDFQTIARGTLRRHDWENFSDEQKREFIDLFTNLLGNTYLEKLQSEYQDEKVIFLNQEMISDTTAIVRSKVVRQSMEYPVDYRMIRRGGTWRIYNVIVENISLVTNYRDQFSQMLMRDSPEQFLDKLRERVNKAVTS
jgi:phospholipid transport system substrate-binding protein